MLARPRAQKLSPDQIDPRNSLQFYTREAVKNADYWDDRAVRAEYSRLRDIAQKRLKRLAKAEPDSYAYRHNVGRYGTARSLSTSEIRALLPDLAKFIAAKTGSVSGIQRQRALSVETLIEHGYTGITTANYKQFAEFMREWRAQKLQRVWGSPDVIDLFTWSQDQQIPWDKIKDRFELWLENQKQLEQYVELMSGEDISADDIVQALDKLTSGKKKYSTVEKIVKQDKKRKAQDKKRMAQETRA